jgi:hypothetical protein
MDDRQQHTEEDRGDEEGVQRAKERAERPRRMTDDREERFVRLGERDAEQSRRSS